MNQAKSFLTVLTLLFLGEGAWASEIEKIVAIQQSQIQKLIEDNKLLRSDFELHTQSFKGLSVMQFYNSWGYSQYPTESASPYSKMPFPINAAGYGGAYVLICSSNASTGNSTRSSVHLVRAGYDGNNYSMETISGKDTPVIFSHRVRSDEYIEV